MKRRRTLTILGFAVIVAVGAAFLAADPPDPVGPTKPTREQNLDASGHIAVHEQGVAQVDITNSSLTVEGTVDVGQVYSTVDVNVTGGTVDVGNEVDVNVTGGMLDEVTAMAPTIERLEANLPIGMGAGEQEIWTFPTVDTTWLCITSEDDETIVIVSGPLGPVHLFNNEDGVKTVYSQVFHYPVPINEVEVWCRNESENCQVYVTVAGF